MHCNRFCTRRSHKHLYESAPSHATHFIASEEKPEGPDEVEGEDEGDNGDNSLTPKLTWRRSLERLWPFRSSSLCSHDVHHYVNSLRMRNNKNKNRTRTKMSLHRSLASFPKPCQKTSRSRLHANNPFPATLSEASKLAACRDHRQRRCRLRVNPS